MKKLLFILASIVFTTIVYAQEKHNTDPMLLEVSVNGKILDFDKENVGEPSLENYYHINWPYKKRDKDEGRKNFTLYNCFPKETIDVNLKSFKVTILDADSITTTNYLFSKEGMTPIEHSTPNKKEYYHVGNWLNSTAEANGWKKNDFLTEGNGKHLEKINVLKIGVADDGTCMVCFEFINNLDIETIQTNEKEVEAYFTVNGFKLPNKPTQNGLYIVKYKNGTSQKIFINE